MLLNSHMVKPVVTSRDKVPHQSARIEPSLSQTDLLDLRSTSELPRRRRCRANMHNRSEEDLLQSTIKQCNSFFL